MDFLNKVILCSIFIVLRILNSYGQGFGRSFSPFGQQSFGGNVFIPTNFPQAVDRTIDIERQGGFSISSPDSTQGVQLMETTISDGNRIIFQDRGGQQGGRDGRPNNFQDRNFGQTFTTNLQGGRQEFSPQNIQGGRQEFNPQNIQGGRQEFTPQQGGRQEFPPQNIQGGGQEFPQSGPTFVTQTGMTGFPNSQVEFVRGPGTLGSAQTTIGGFLPGPRGFPNPNPFLGPPATPTAGLMNTAISGFPTNIGPFPTAVPNNQVNTRQEFPPRGNFQGNQFQGTPGNQQFQGTQFQIGPGTREEFQGLPGNQQFQGNQFQQAPGTRDDTFNQRFSLIDPTTNTAVRDVPGVQNQQAPEFQANQGFQQPPQNNFFAQPQNPNPGQFAGPFRPPPQPATNQFAGGFENSPFQNTAQLPNQQPPSQFIGNQGFNSVRRSEFTNTNDVQTSSNIGVRQGNEMNATISHGMDPSIGVFLPDVLLDNVGQASNRQFSQFGTTGFSDIFENNPRPSPIPDVMKNLGPGFTTMSPPQSTTEGYSCQHKECLKGQACVYDGKYRCPKWIPIITCKCLSGCMYNDWFIPKKFVIPVDHCGNHCACERDDGIATCSQTKCPDAP